MAIAGMFRERYLAALGVVRYVPRDVPAAEEAGKTSAPAEPEQDVSQAGEVAAPAPEVSSEVPQAPAEELAFRLAFWQPSPHLIVLSSLPPGRRPSEEEVVMLQRLLRAIDGLPGELPSGEWLDWPLAPGAASDLAGAREMLGVFLDVKARLQPFATALLMGEAAARAAGGLNDLQVGDRVSLECGAEGVITHSLYDMSRDASLKRPTWETLQTLVAQRSS